MGIIRHRGRIPVKYPISEIFTSIKGEGRDVGKRATFVRFYGCNFNCDFCDSKYAHRGGDYTDMTIDEILDKVPAGMPLVITGGEPLLHDIAPLVQTFLRREGRQNQIEIETNGSFFRKIYYVDFTVSPKLALIEDGYLEALRKFELCDATFKFVIKNKDDFDTVIALTEEVSMSNIVLMPEGITQENILNTSRKIADWMLDYPERLENMQLIPRLHILLWGNERGK
jgi:7-carboxy-7-deazaguanine synthase